MTELMTEYEMVKAFVSEHYDGSYETHRDRDYPGEGTRLWVTTLHGPGGPLVFTKVSADGEQLTDVTRP